MSLPQHAPFQVAHVRALDSHRTDLDFYLPVHGGVTSIEASTMCGPTCKKKMLRLRDALTLFADKRLLSAYDNELKSAHPVLTSMKVIRHGEPLANIPEGELKVIIDGKTFIKTKDYNTTELIQVDDRVLNLGKEFQIIKAEHNWVTEYNYQDSSEDNRVYVTHMLEGNDQMSIDMPDGGWRNLGDLANLLFSEKELNNGDFAKRWLREYGYLEVQSPFYMGSAVFGGLASAGEIANCEYNGPYLGIKIPDRVRGISGVLIYADSDGAANTAKVDIKTQLAVSARAVIYDMEQAGLDEKLLAPLRALVDYVEK